MKLFIDGRHNFNVRGQVIANDNLKKLYTAESRVSIKAKLRRRRVSTRPPKYV